MPATCAVRTCVKALAREIEAVDELPPHCRVQRMLGITGLADVEPDADLAQARRCAQEIGDGGSIRR